MQEARTYRIFILSTSMVVVLCMTGIFLGLFINTRRLIYDSVLDRARAHFRDITLARTWNAGYGGVYVEKKAGMQSNPYLENPDIRSVDGKIYTLKNPALMTREISDYAEKSGLFSFRMTSLKPLNPNNKPDEFEREALTSFEKGKKEFYRQGLKNRRTFFRYMAPLYVEETCLGCHKKQGYKTGDIRGGIDITFDIEDIQDRLRRDFIIMVAVSLISISILLGSIYYFTLKMIRRISVAYNIIEKLAILDGLTGLLNRRHVMARFTEEFDRARRLQKDLGCIMFDIDDFKQVNDKYGHLAGDEVLKEISAIVKKSVRTYDIAGRYGGEEFIVILPDTAFEDSRALAERLRINIKGMVVSLPGLRLEKSVTISLGITHIKETDSGIDDIIKRADDGLYKAKSAGKNRAEYI